MDVVYIYLKQVKEGERKMDNNFFKYNENFNKMAQTIQTINDSIIKLAEPLVLYQNTFQDLLDSYNTSTAAIVDNMTIALQRYNTITDSFASVYSNYDEMMEKIGSSLEIIFCSLNMNLTSAGYVFQDEDGDDETVTNDEIHELSNDIVIIIENKFSAEAIDKCKEKWTDKHPFIFNIIVGIILLIITPIITAAQSFVGNIYTAVTTDLTQIYREADEKSEIILELPSNSKITVIDNTEDFCKVYITVNDSDEEVEGFIKAERITLQEENTKE